MTGQNQTAGDGSVAIQVAGDNVVISIGAASLTLAQRHQLRAVPTSERELLLTELRGTDLVGRDHAAAGRRTVTSPRPASRPSTEMSSSRSSQCRPFPVTLIRHCPRCAGVACSNRGNHAIGTPIVRPSCSSTHIVTSSNRTAFAEVLMPCPHDFVSPPFDDPYQFSLLTSGESEALRDPDVGAHP
jgi:hypothetical protein